MNFDPLIDRYCQIEDTLKRRFERIGSYSVSLMKPHEIKAMDKLADDGLDGRQILSTGLIIQLIEVENEHRQN